ncbi:hypothetical protein H6F46_02525 [Limnothrix sp. FACHB-1083]|uniref:hypothetical protein n=1 Tax=unclassified Limnothrix TaxID=2632864 RepID=UPI001680EB63|nr:MULTISPECIES: hypothetical protein [unclassified Limnothrix]MBD2159563.1 hypothetical protein [Limnothrix sp. FACHB-1083]MBD2190265.1 hypothetical protein [Limnothrix sp. FACHB-1088]
MAGKPTYGERKKTVGYSLTPTAIARLEAMAEAMGLRSPSEVIEQFARGLLSPDQPDPDLLRMGKIHAI